MGKRPQVEQASMTAEATYSVLWPRSPRQTLKRSLSPRLKTLNEKTVAQLWDYLFRGDEVFEMLEEGIRARYPDVKFISWREFGNTHGPDEHKVVASLPSRLKQLGADAVISGMGC